MGFDLTRHLKQPSPFYFKSQSPKPGPYSTSCLKLSQTIINLSNLTPFLPPRALPIYFSCRAYLLLSRGSCYLKCISYFCLEKHWVQWENAYHNPEIYSWIILFNLPYTVSVWFIAGHSAMCHHCSVMQLIFILWRYEYVLYFSVFFENQQIRYLPLYTLQYIPVCWNYNCSFNLQDNAFVSYKMNITNSSIKKLWITNDL